MEAEKRKQKRIEVGADHFCHATRELDVLGRGVGHLVLEEITLILLSVAHIDETHLDDLTPAQHK